VSTTFRTYSFRIRDSTSKKYLNRMSQSANVVWNYCNEVHIEAARRKRKWLTAFDFHKLTSCISKDLGIHSQTVQRVCEEYATRIRQVKKRKLRWRGRKSLGWVPFKASGIKLEEDTVTYSRRTFKFWKSRKVEGIIKCGSFSQDARHRWYVNITCEVPAMESKSTDKSIGIDLGLKDLATISTGEIINNPSSYRVYESRLAKNQRAKKTKQVRNIHAKIKNKRKDFLHKLSTRLVDDNDIIVIGNVKSSSIGKTRMAKSVYDAGWFMFKTMLRYKAIKQGKVFLEVNEAYTTVTCNVCNKRTGPSGIGSLKIREWACSNCGTIHDRDHNAALNILAIGHDSLSQTEAA